ncbi:MAG: serine/threonine-protein kinase RsbW [Bryobacterales bacterium]|nr:serine/threonine-protein kinase RsbW [Bryobacterales bacterium]
MVAFRLPSQLVTVIGRVVTRILINVDIGTQALIDQDYPSTLESVDQAEASVLEVSGQAGFDEDEQHRIGMAFRECMVNAVVHGNRYNRKKQVHLRVTKSNERFTIQVTDQGEGFEVQEVPDPLDENNLLRHSGRGLFLMGAFMDDVKVRKVSPSGTEVTLVKNVEPRQ